MKSAKPRSFKKLESMPDNLAQLLKRGDEVFGPFKIPEIVNNPS